MYVKLFKYKSIKVTFPIHNDKFKVTMNDENCHRNITSRKKEETTVTLPISTKIPIVLDDSQSTNMSYIQHQIDDLNSKIERFIEEQTSSNRCRERDETKILYKN